MTSGDLNWGSSRLILRWSRSGWVALIMGPAFAREFQLMGTDVLPLPFGPGADVAVVLAATLATPMGQRAGVAVEVGAPVLS